jgi:hypothetical protein
MVTFLLPFGHFDHFPVVLPHVLDTSMAKASGGGAVRDVSAGILW